MENTRELMTAVKQRHGLTSDYQLAKFLSLSRQRVSANLHGGTVMNDETALKVADALGIERGRVLAIVAAERAPTPTTKKEWLKLAATAALVLVAIVGADHGGQLAALAVAFPAGVTEGTLVIMLNAVPALLAAILALVLLSRSRAQTPRAQ